MAFNPNETTLKEGLQLVDRLQKELGIDNTKIFTSEDVPDLYANKSAQVTNVPGGFNKIIVDENFRRDRQRVWPDLPMTANEARY